jgi:twitching motility two-component system response regulator PilG
MAAALAREFDCAYKLLQRATTESPGDVRAWFWRALASPNQPEAVSCLRRVLLFEPGHEQAQHALARLLIAEAATVASSGQADRALALAKEAVDLFSDSDAIWIGYAAVCQVPSERLAAVRRAAAINPQAPDIRLLLRDALLHCGVTVAGVHPDQAQQLFREASTIDPDDVRVWQALARVASTAHDAVQALRELLRLAPERPGVRAAFKRALNAEAVRLAGAGSRQESAACWRESVSVDEQDVNSWIGLAATTDDAAEAQRALDAAARLQPADPRVAALRARWHAGPPPADAPAPVAPPAPVVSAPRPVEATPIPIAPAPLPVTPAPAVAPAQGQSQPAVSPASAAPAPGKRTVLVVDDSPTVRKILAMTLERNGYAVASAPDGEAAIVSLEQSVPDLILLDISMPKLDGYEVCKRIKANARTAHIPVVMLSGKDAFFDKVKGRMAGATEYLTKPFETPAVLAVIGRQLEADTSTAHG